MVYILVSINIKVGKDMDSGHYIFYVLYYNTWTWWNCDNYTISNYSGYLENIYNDLSNANEQKNGKIIINGSDRIVSMLYIKRDIIAFNAYSFCNGKSVSKYIENIE